MKSNEQICISMKCHKKLTKFQIVFIFLEIENLSEQKHSNTLNSESGRLGPTRNLKNSKIRENSNHRNEHLRQIQWKPPRGSEKGQN